MAHIEPMGFNGLEELAKGLDELTYNIEDIAKNCIEAAEPAMESIYRGALGKVAASYISTSVSTTKPKRNFLGVFGVSRPVGYKPYSKHGRNYDRKSYYMIASLLNYGATSHYICFSRPNMYGFDHWVSHKYGDVHPGMKATPWHEEAVKTADGVVTKIVIDKFESEVSRLTHQ